MMYNVKNFRALRGILAHEIGQTTELNLMMKRDIAFYIYLQWLLLDIPSSPCAQQVLFPLSMI